MNKKKMLDGKRILLVDDEPDVLDTLEELLNMCHISRAATFSEAEAQLKSKYFDIAILDIMGVDGFRLLEIAKNRKVIAVILTGHALSLDNTLKSFREGAASYVPKEKMGSIAVYLNDILEAKESGKNFCWRWLDRFMSFYDEKFGPDWQHRDKEFWEKFPYI